jgi:hypothetical protein
MRQWDEGGGQPSFGHRAYWIEDVLDSLDASEIASYALADGGANGEGESTPGAGADEASIPRRFLVACELGILDARAAADVDGNPALTSVLVPWADVHGIRLSPATGLDDAFRHATMWSLSLAAPDVRIADPDQPDALLELVRECLTRTNRP